MTAKLYDTDFYGWILQQARLLKEGRFAELDTANVVEELETLGRTEKRILKTMLADLFAYRYEWQGQEDTATLRAYTQKITEHLQESPTLWLYLPEITAKAWQAARLDMARSRIFELEGTPEDAPWSFDELMQYQG